MQALSQAADPVEVSEHRVRHALFVAACRTFFVVLGLALTLVSVGLCLSVVLAPLGVATGLVGLGLAYWGATGDVEIRRRGERHS